MQITLSQYLIIINAAGFLFMLLDKTFARKHLWRIPEAVLLMIALCGGSLGSLLGMQFFRHKTQKLKFRVFVPLCLILHIILLAVGLSTGYLQTIL